MARFARYLREEQYITAQDNGGIRKRWEYGRRLLMDGKATHPNGRLKHGVGDTLVANATASGYKLSLSEIRYRLQAGKTYDTEAKLAKILGEFDNWWSLIQAGFPQVEAPDDAESYDPRDADERRRDARAEIDRRLTANPHQGELFAWNPPHQFRGDEHGPRSTLKELYAVCEESERYTAGMAEYDARRRAYLDECASAVDGDVSKTWYEAEQRRKGLDALGLTDWDSFTEIMDEFFRLHDDSSAIGDGGDEGDDDTDDPD